MIPESARLYRCIFESEIADLADTKDQGTLRTFADDTISGAPAFFRQTWPFYLTICCKWSASVCQGKFNLAAAEKLKSIVSFILLEPISFGSER
ncbi:MAG TPA: hypothetical protein DDW52_23580 [Planctomycetaceae bacterium]|nr:hypothetical protein [Planctomycetaceae bacterium]